MTHIINFYILVSMVSLLNLAFSHAMFDKKLTTCSFRHNFSERYNNNTSDFINRDSSNQFLINLKHGKQNGVKDVHLLVTSPDKAKDAVYTAGSFHGFVKIQKSKGNKTLATLKHDSGIRKLIWSPDSSRILTFTACNDVWIWDMKTYECLVRFRTILSRNYNIIGRIPENVDLNKVVDWNKYGIIFNKNLHVLKQTKQYESRFQYFVKLASSYLGLYNPNSDDYSYEHEVIPQTITFVEPEKWLYLAKKRHDLFDSKDCTGVEPDVLVNYLNDVH